MFKTLKSFFDALASLFSWQEVAIKNKPLSEIINDKKDLEKACIYAEKAIELVYKKCEFKRKFSKFEFCVLVRKFRHYR